MQRSLFIPIFLQISVYIPSIYMKTYSLVLYLHISNFLRTLIQCSSVRTNHKMDRGQYGVEVTFQIRKICLIFYMHNFLNRSCILKLVFQIRNYKIARKVNHFTSSRIKIAFITFETDGIKGRRGKSGKTQRKLVCKEDSFNQT